MCLTSLEMFLAYWNELKNDLKYVLKRLFTRGGGDANLPKI